MIYDYFVYGDIENHDEIRIALIEKMQKMQCHRLYSLSKKAPTEEEREGVRQAWYLVFKKVQKYIASSFNRYSAAYRSVTVRGI